MPQLPESLATRVTGFAMKGELKLNRATASDVEEAVREIPALIDRVDALIADGTIGGDQPNVADLQIAGSVRLLLNLEDVREPIESRPAGEHARRLMPEYPGHVPAGALPAEWLAEARLGETRPEPATV